MEIMNINPTNLVVTCGVMAMKGVGFNSVEDDYLFAPALGSLVEKTFNQMPDRCEDGGNDKEFFTVEFRGKKLFVAVNEVRGLTVMLPSEY